MSKFKALMLSAAMCSTMGAAQAEEETRIPLKIFGQNVIEGYDGCSFSLWQHNRDPNEDAYAYVFYAPIHDGGEMPGWMKIGDNVHEMYRQDTSESGDGYLSSYQLYKSGDGEYWVIMELISQQREGNDIIIDNAELTIVQSGKFPFVSVAKGKSGCPAHMYAQTEVMPRSYNLPGDAITLNFEEEFFDINAVPASIRRYVNENYASCDLGNGASYSVRYSISDTMSLWQVPCATYASSATASYFTIFNNNPEYFAPVYANHPEGLAGFSNGDLKELMNPIVAPATGGISAWEDHGNGECGVFWQYQLRAVEGEAVEAFLAEYRRKDSCDGEYVEPENMPAIYVAN